MIDLLLSMEKTDDSTVKQSVDTLKDILQYLGSDDEPFVYDADNDPYFGYSTDSYN